MNNTRIMNKKNNQQIFLSRYLEQTCIFLSILPSAGSPFFDADVLPIF